MSKARQWPKGIRKTPYGWQVYARRDGVYRSQRFPHETELTALKAARETLIGQIRLKLTPASIDGDTLAFDATRYLAVVTGMSSYSDRAYHINQWVNALGHRVRRSLTAIDLQAVLESWRKTGSADGGPLSHGSLNRRRTALMHLYTTLDGKSAPNVVKDVPAYDERASHQIRALSLITVARLIRHVRPSSQTRARLHVLMWTGWPHALIKALRPDDIDWKAGRVRVARRKKGLGMPSVWVPVVPRAIVALRRFAALNCWGEYSHNSIHKTLTLAAKKENAVRARTAQPPIGRVHPYMLRHTFGTWAAGILQDDRALKELLRTNSVQRYTEGALAGRLEQARAQLASRTTKRSR